MLASLGAGLAGNVVAVLRLWLRLRWKTAQQTGHGQQLTELARVLPSGSSVDFRHDSGGLHTKLTVGTGRAREQRGRL
ncbi:hypothetical protein [Nocardia paucivorans]|uniref:hypothetical protein n=1 Tax=Nocardia paucivorans TaxID=114259 RepID=UPI0012FA71DD|nr:hypothetical protein [Nocardia paucivorans]